MSSSSAIYLEVVSHPRRGSGSHSAMVGGCETWGEGYLLVIQNPTTKVAAFDKTENLL